MKQKQLTDSAVISEVRRMLESYESSFTMPGDLPLQNDELDPIREKLNELARRAREYRTRSADYQKRVEGLLNVLLRYALFDFSVKAEVTEAGDEIDAIALGINTVAEELLAARETEKRQLDVIREKNDQVEVILANAPSAVVVIDASGNVTRWNKRAEAIFGYQADEAIGKSVTSLIAPTSHSDGMDKYFGKAAGTLLDRQVEVTARRKDGTEFPAELGVSAVRSGGEEFYIGFLNDISARKSSEARIRAANMQLESSNRELESFSYSVSHDLRAPLRAINGYTQILMKEYAEEFDARGTQMMKAVLSNVKRMGQLIDDLLALSRFGRAELKPQKTDMNRLVSNVLAEIGKQTDLSRTEVIAERLPSAMADPTLITQAVNNLLSNAIKYSSKVDKPLVQVGALKEDGETVYFIKDNGSGFDMRFYNKLFGVFQRLHDSSEFEGTGVGLAIVKRIIERHHGRIWADAEPGKGATFYFTIGTNHHERN